MLGIDRFEKFTRYFKRETERKKHRNPTSAVLWGIGLVAMSIPYYTWASVLCLAHPAKTARLIGDFTGREEFHQEADIIDDKIDEIGRMVRILSHPESFI